MNNKTDAEIAESARARAKKQNEAARKMYDVVSVRLPKGTKERITTKNLIVNGFICSTVLEKLEQLENK